VRLVDLMPDDVNNDLTARAAPCSSVHMGLPVDQSLPRELRPMQSLYQILMLLLDIVWFFIIAHVIMSWLINFQVLNLRQPIVAQIWDGLNRLLEPMYSRLRRILPQMSGIDLAPLVALIGVYVLRIVLQNNAGFFYGF
jgi:YggT family protein